MTNFYVLGNYTTGLICLRIFNLYRKEGDDDGKRLIKKSNEYGR